MSDKLNIEELIVRYLFQDISEEDILRLNTWINQSDENKQLFFKIKQIHDTISKGEQPGEQYMEESWQRLYSRMNNQSPSVSSDGDRKKISQTFLWILQYAAVIAVAVTIGLGIGKNNQKKEELQQTTYNDIHVDKGGKPNRLILSDGSKVRLNAATTFSYPTNFSTEKREVFLNGEAYFEVADNAEKPFIVNIKQQSITVLGTNFNVEAYNESTYSIITLLSGKISLQTFNKKGEAISQLVLKPNQKVYFDLVKETVALENVDASLSNVWINGEYKFKDEPLLLIVKRLEKYYDVNIHLEDESLKKIRYTGTFSLNQSIRDVLNIINYERQFVYKKTGKDVFITPR